MMGLLRRAGRRLGQLPSGVVDRTVMAFFLRLAPSEGRRVFVVTILVGGLCGLAAVAFDRSIHIAEVLLIDRAMAAPGLMWMVWTLVMPALGAVVAGVLLTYVVPDARGSGVPQVKVAYLTKDGLVPFRVALAKFAISALQIGSGASLGRQGPIVQICAGIASRLGRSAALSARQQRLLLPVGVAAGIAAAFNAPLAAVTFAVEELVGELDQTLLTGIVVAAAVATLIERALLGAGPVLHVPAGYGLDHPESLLLYIGLGLAAALVSLAFSEALLRVRAGFARLGRVPRWLRPALGGLVVGVLIVGARLGLDAGGINGGGYGVLDQALRGALPLKLLLALCALKLVATTFSYSSGGAGGLFVPTLFVGGMLGGSVGALDAALFHHADAARQIGSFALVGMGAVFAGFLRAPITSVLIVVEMTGSYGLVLPLMFANMTAYTLARALRPVSLYEALLEQDGIRLPKAGHPPLHVPERLRVPQALTRAVTTLPGGLRVDQAPEQLPPQHFASYPVLDGERFCGLIDPPAFQRLGPFGGPPGAPASPDGPPLHYQVVTLPPGAPAAGCEVRALDLPPGVLLVTLDRGSQTVVPRGGTLLAAGDRLTLFAAPEQMAAGVSALTGASPHL